jgi:hypothetical protein
MKQDPQENQSKLPPPPSTALERAQKVLGVSAKPPLTDHEFLKQQPRQIKTKSKAVWDEVARQISDHTLRVPKTSDREEAHLFNPWVDIYGQKHGQIDWDAEFQSCAFDPKLGRGSSPDVGDHWNNGLLPDDDLVEKNAIQSMSIQQGGKQIGIRRGSLEHDREIKMRRPTEKTWWIFCAEGHYLEKLLKEKYPRDDINNREKAARALFVLVQFYLRNRTDADIAAPGSSEWMATFQDEKSVKRFRQELIKQGVEMFGVDKDFQRGPRERRFANAKRFVRPKVGGQHGG